MQGLGVAASVFLLQELVDEVDRQAAHGFDVGAGVQVFSWFQRKAGEDCDLVLTGATAGDDRELVEAEDLAERSGRRKPDSDVAVSGVQLEDLGRCGPGCRDD